MTYETPILESHGSVEELTSVVDETYGGPGGHVWTMRYESPTLETYGWIDQLTAVSDGSYGGPGIPGGS